MGLRNIAFLLLLFSHFHLLSLYTIASGSIDATEKLPMSKAIRRGGTGGGHGGHAGGHGGHGHGGHGHGGGEEGSHGSGHRDNDPTWWRQYRGGYANTHHNKASSSRSFSCPVIGVTLLASILLNY